MTRPEQETIWSIRIERRISKQYKLYCPVCHIRFRIGDPVIRTNSIKYVCLGCLDKFRVDSNIEISDEELDNFFNINEDMPSKKEFRRMESHNTKQKVRSTIF